jgi:hypothetical protein
VERDGKSLLEWIRIHSLRGLPGLAGPELRFSQTPTASVLHNDACLWLPARNRFTLMLVFSHSSIRNFHSNTEKITHHIFFDTLNAFKASGINFGQLKLDPKFELVSGVLLGWACCIVKIKCFNWV